MFWVLWTFVFREKCLKKQMHILWNYWGKYFMKINQILKSKGKNSLSFLSEHSPATMLTSILFGVFTHQGFTLIGLPPVMCHLGVIQDRQDSSLHFHLTFCSVFQNQVRSDSLLVLWRICSYSVVDGSQVHLHWAITLKHRGEAMKINTVWVCHQPQAGKMFHFSALQMEYKAV